MANSIRELGSCDDLAVGPAEGPDDVTGRAARGLGGVVPRPGLSGRLGASARVTVLSAPPGSGKTVLLRSWIGEPGRAGRVAWVAVGRGEQIRSGSGCRCSARCAVRRPGRGWCES